MFVTFSSLYSFESVSAPKFEIPHLDKIVHFTFYFVACILGVFFLRERTNGKLPLKKALFFMILGTIVFGLLMEVLQYYMTTARTADALDGLANAIGSIGGGLLMKFYFSGKRRLKWEF